MPSEKLGLALQVLDNTVKSCPTTKAVVPCLSGIIIACRIIYEVIVSPTFQYLSSY